MRDKYRTGTFRNKSLFRTKRRISRDFDNIRQNSTGTELSSGESDVHSQMARDGKTMAIKLEVLTGESFDPENISGLGFAVAAGAELASPRFSRTSLAQAPTPSSMHARKGFGFITNGSPRSRFENQTSSNHQKKIHSDTLTHLFQVAAKAPRDGGPPVIGLEELSEVLMDESLSSTIGRTHVSRTFCKALLDILDTDKSGTLDCAEFIESFSSLVEGEVLVTKGLTGAFLKAYEVDCKYLRASRKETIEDAKAIRHAKELAAAQHKNGMNAMREHFTDESTQLKNEMDQLRAANRRLEASNSAAKKAETDAHLELVKMSLLEAELTRCRIELEFYQKQEEKMLRRAPSSPTPLDRQLSDSLDAETALRYAAEADAKMQAALKLEAQAELTKCKIELRRLQDEYDEFERRNSIIIIDLTKKASTGAAETARQVQLKTQMEQALLKATTMKVTAESALATCQNDLERSHIELRRESTSNEAAKSELTACKSNLNHARTELNESRSQPSLPDGNFEELLQSAQLEMTNMARFLEQSYRDHSELITELEETRVTQASEKDGQAVALQDAVMKLAAQDVRTESLLAELKTARDGLRDLAEDLSAKQRALLEQRQIADGALRRSDSKQMEVDRLQQANNGLQIEVDQLKSDFYKCKSERDTAARTKTLVEDALREHQGFCTQNHRTGDCTACNQNTAANHEAEARHNRLLTRCNELEAFVAQLQQRCNELEHPAAEIVTVEVPVLATPTRCNAADEYRFQEYLQLLRDNMGLSCALAQKESRTVQQLKPRATIPRQEQTATELIDADLYRSAGRALSHHLLYRVTVLDHTSSRFKQLRGSTCTVRSRGTKKGIEFANGEQVLLKCPSKLVQDVAIDSTTGTIVMNLGTLGSIAMSAHVDPVGLYKELSAFSRK
jgi:hypothetical protein